MVDSSGSGGAAAADPAAMSGADLQELFRTEPQAAAVLRAAPPGCAPRTSGYVLAPVARRHNGRTVLVGDAAHPVGAGQGASMAMEDAVVAGPGTGRLVRPSPRDWPLSTGERQPRSGKLAKTEAANRDAKVAGPVATRMRELIMPHVFNRFYEKATGWLYEYDPGRCPAAMSGTG